MPPLPGAPGAGLAETTSPLGPPGYPARSRDRSAADDPPTTTRPVARTRHSAGLTAVSSVADVYRCEECQATTGWSRRRRRTRTWPAECARIRRWRLATPVEA